MVSAIELLDTISTTVPLTRGLSAEDLDKQGKRYAPG
jgi:hypothetical protein